MRSPNLCDIIIPESVSKMESNAFRSCTKLTCIKIPSGVLELSEVAIFDNIFLEEIIVEDMFTSFGTCSIGFGEGRVSGITQDEFVALYNKLLESNFYDDVATEEFMKYYTFYEKPIIIGTIYCHSGSTAEAYAIENGIDYELTHFFKGEWTYDYDNMVRTRKCIHCDELEIEELEAPETPDKPENPVVPDTPDTTECDCICHSTGFLNRILAIVYRIFLKLLGTSPLCECGVAHY